MNFFLLFSFVFLFFFLFNFFFRLLFCFFHSPIPRSQSMRNVSSAYPSIEYVNISSVSLEPPLTTLDDLLTRFYLSKFVPLLSGNDNEALFRASRKRITRPSGERNVLPVMTVKILWRNRKRIMGGKRRETPFLFNARAGISSKGKSVGSFNNGGVVVVKERPRFYATCRSKERHET